jgi:hypothetical protein
MPARSREGSSPARGAYPIALALALACGNAERDPDPRAGEAPREGGAADASEDPGPGAPGGSASQGLDGASGGSSSRSLEAGDWLAPCQACAGDTPACSDETCLRCLFEEPQLSNEHCPAGPDGFYIESFGILNAECRDACGLR